MAEVVFEESLPFFDLSGIPDVHELPRTQDSNSEVIFVPDGLRFGDISVTQIYVSGDFNSEGLPQLATN